MSMLGKGETGRILDGVKVKIQDAEAVKAVQDRLRFRKDIGICRGICRLPRQVSRFLGLHLMTALNDNCPVIACIGCGIGAEKGNSWNTKSPMDVVLETSRSNDRIKTFARGLIHSPVPDIKPKRGVILKNGFCLTCGRKFSRLIPEAYRIRIDDTPGVKLVPTMRTGSVEDAVLHLQKHNVIFDEERFRELWSRSIQLEV